MKRPKYILNQDVLYEMIVSKRLTVDEFAERVGIIRQTLWRLTLPQSSPNFGYVTELTLKKFKAALTLNDGEVKRLFILP